MVRTTGSRFATNVISAVSAKGQRRFMVTPERATATVYVEFLGRLIHNQDRPTFLIVDDRSTHPAQPVKDLVPQTSGPLRRFYLPPDSPQLDPEEWAWRHVPRHRAGRAVVTGPPGPGTCSPLPAPPAEAPPPPSAASSTFPISTTSSEMRAYQRLPDRRRQGRQAARSRGVHARRPSARRGGPDWTQGVAAARIYQATLTNLEV